MPHHFIDVAVWKRYKHWASNQISVDRYPRRARGEAGGKGAQGGRGGSGRLHADGGAG